MRIEGTVAIVTGGASGTGLAISDSLAGAGATVLVVDVDGDAAERASARIRDHAGAGVAVHADVCLGGDREAILARAVDLGGPQVLVNNAGGWGGAGRQFPDATEAEWRAVLELNLLAPMALTGLCRGPMAASGGGAVVNVGSSAGRGSGDYGSPEYGAAKAGLARFTTSIAGWAPRDGIRVNCVVPDWIGLDRAHAELAAMSPARRAAAPPLIPPADVAATVVRLVTDDSLAGRVVVLAGGAEPLLLPAG